MAAPGPRPRASLLATLGLIFGVSAVLIVLTGAPAGYGIALGAIALVLSITGSSATGRRHVTGKTDAVIGLLLSIAAVVIGGLALTGKFAWPTTTPVPSSVPRSGLTHSFCTVSDGYCLRRER